MRTIAHLSDLHFGRVDESVLDPLRRLLHSIAPDVLVVSGDLTQRAKPGQFREARAWLDTLPTPQVVVPGNHDVPLYNVFRRFLSPLGAYRRIVTDDLEPAFMDEEIAVMGVNTARSFVFKGGRINEEQVERVRERICHLPDAVTKILVTHHPFDAPKEGDDEDQIVGRAAMALEKLASCGADVLLSGHLHASNVSHTSERYCIGGLNALVVQAGTATSVRHRGETNSFNVLRVESHHIEVDRYAWQGGAFQHAATEAFDHQPPQGWKAANPRNG